MEVSRSGQAVERRSSDSFLSRQARAHELGVGRCFGLVAEVRGEVLGLHGEVSPQEPQKPCAPTDAIRSPRGGAPWTARVPRSSARSAPSRS